MPTYSGLIPTIMVQSLLQLRKPMACGFMAIDRQRIDKARNALALEALNKNFDYLFMVDDDNPIPPDTLEKMVEDDKDIVTVPILSRTPDRNGNYKMCAFYSREIEANGKPLNLYFNIDTFRDEGNLHRVDATGTGCLLVKRNVLETLIKKYDGEVFAFGDIKFDKNVIVDGKSYDRRTMSEDCEFSERAVKEGFEIWLDERIKPLHITNFNMIKWGER